ncbi:hypothetical protein SO802_008084 [Lithocarpus litseifolius]|uniref:Uncharacterized protein n=1 Tax=Lithocarpus litseifolius TaxID=425828 RepID=A0AAW2D857_9ROSI
MRACRVLSRHKSHTGQIPYVLTPLVLRQCIVGKAFMQARQEMHSGEGIHAGTPDEDSDLCWDVEGPHPFPERGASIIS